jgi:transcription elongation factor Elf1
VCKKEVVAEIDTYLERESGISQTVTSEKCECGAELDFTYNGDVTVSFINQHRYECEHCGRISADVFPDNHTDMIICKFGTGCMSTVAPVVVNQHAPSTLAFPYNEWVDLYNEGKIDASEFVSEMETDGFDGDLTDFL